MKSFQLAATAIFATTTMAMAQEKVQVSYSGVVSVEQVSGLNASENYLYGNGDVSFRWSTASDLKFGVDLGIEAYHLSNDDLTYNTSAYYAAGVVEGQFGKVSIGMPRSVMNEYFNIPKIGGSEVLGLELGFIHSDLVRYIKIYLEDSEGKFYGARYVGEIGKVDVAASVANLSDYPVSIEEIVIHYNAGQWSVTLGTTQFEEDGDSANITSLEVQAKSGKFSGGLVLSKVNEILAGAGSFEEAISHAFISYDVNDAIKMNAQVLNYYQSDILREKVYSIDLDYKHKTGAFLNAGLITSEKWINKIYNVSLGYKF
jgi:hypothetical protein